MTTSAAVTAGYTLAAGPVRAEIIKTDTHGLTAGDTKIKVADGEMPGYFARPSGVSNPPVVLVAMEIFGLHEYIKDVTRRLAKLGAFAIAPDYYFRKGVDLTKLFDIAQLLPVVNAKPDGELLSDLDSTVAWAKSQGGDTSRLGIIGFCRGGRTVWEYAAHSTALKAGVAFYGPPDDPTKPAVAEESDPTCSRHESTGAGPVWRGRHRHSRRNRRGFESSVGEKQEDRRVQDLPRRATRLPRRLSRQLSPGSRRGCVEPDASLVQEIQSTRLIIRKYARLAPRALVLSSGNACRRGHDDQPQTSTGLIRQPDGVCTRRRTT
jgi:Dienelactone hydrolase family